MAQKRLEPHRFGRGVAGVWTLSWRTARSSMPASFALHESCAAPTRSSYPILVLSPLNRQNDFLNLGTSNKRSRFAW